MEHKNFALNSDKLNKTDIHHKNFTKLTNNDGIVVFDEHMTIDGIPICSESQTPYIFNFFLFYGYWRCVVLDNNMNIVKNAEISFAVFYIGYYY